MRHLRGENQSRRVSKPKRVGEGLNTASTPTPTEARNSDSAGQASDSFKALSRMEDFDKVTSVRSSEDHVLGLVTLSDRPVPSESLLKSYCEQHLQPGHGLSKTIFFQCTPPLNYNKWPNTDLEVQFVDISADGLALVSSSGAEVAFKERQYLYLMTVLSGVHDLVLSYPDNISVSALDTWFNTAHDAGVQRYILDRPFGLPARIQTSQDHLLNVSTRLKWLGGDTQIYSLGAQHAFNVEAPGEFQFRSNRPFEDPHWQAYCQELKNKLRSLRDLRTRLLKTEKRRYDQSEDAQLHRLSLIIQRLGSRRNALSPVSCLPPELLGRIFAFTSCVNGTYGNYPPPLAWVKISHVCRYWRDVALHTPSVWSNIPAFVPRWTEEMLKRSKSSPIRVYYNEGDALLDRPGYSALRFALEHLDRITDVFISTNAPYLDIPTHPAPILERFTLLMDAGPRGASIVLTRNLFSGIAPRLQHISLGGAYFDLNSILFQNLTSLNLSNITLWAPGSANFMEILINRLAGIPKLEELYLCDALPKVGPEATSHTENRTNLPSLIKLHIRDSPLPNILDFTRRIVVKNGTLEIPLQLGFGLNSVRNLSRPLFAEIGRLSKLNDHPFRSVRISRYSGHISGPLIEAWSSVDGPISTTSVPELSLDLRVGDFDYTSISIALERIFSSLPFSGTLVVAVRGIDLKSSWWSAIRLLHRVHTIYLHRCPPAPLLSALSITSDTISSLRNTPNSRLNFLPDLRILLFRDVFFGNKMKHLTTLAKVLSHRKQIPNSAIIQLQFDQCRGMTEAHALVFQKVVANVAWTEMKDAESDEEEYDGSQSDD